MFNHQAHESTVTFKQQGQALAGQGVDESGTPFVIQEGKVSGTRVHFLKKYIGSDPSKQPVDYTGQLTYENDSDFKDWTLGGHYRTTISGQNVDDKWVAIRAAAEKAADQSPSPPGTPPQPQGGAPQPPPPQVSGNDTGSGADQSAPIPDDISGTYTANYDFNFKKMECRLWLKQNENSIGGDGIDTNTGEHFFIPTGVYRPGHDGIPPSVKFQCHYTKGMHAAATRDLVIEAAVGPGPTLTGETQFGSSWTANYITH